MAPVAGAKTTKMLKDLSLVSLNPLFFKKCLYKKFQNNINKYANLDKIKELIFRLHQFDMGFPLFQGICHINSSFYHELLVCIS